VRKLIVPGLFGSVLGGLVLSIVLQAQTPASPPPRKTAPPAAAQPASPQPPAARPQPAPQPQPQPTRTAAAARPSVPSAQEQTALIKQYCIGCHSERGKAGGLSLVDFDVAKAASNSLVAEKMVRKLRAGMMPPAGARRPDEAALTALVTHLEMRLDGAVEGNVNPGYRPFQRLNRAEYSRAVNDLLDLPIDVSPFLPPDSISNGFDNVADAQSFSPTLMEGYLRAAGKIAALAIGDPEAPASESNYKPPKTASQLRRVEGAPVGTRGGVSVMHTFPADGDYVFRMDLMSNACGVLFGGTAEGEQLEVSIDGERAALLPIDPKMIESTTGVTLKTSPLHIKAGTRRVSAAFIQHSEGPVIDLIAPIEHTLADTQIGVAYGITTFPHLKDMSIVGPYRVSGVSDTASRRKVFSCRPTAQGEERACAGDIVKRLATEAFRRPVAERDLTALMQFYDETRKEAGFEQGVAAALEAILASPQFLFRLEPVPAVVAADGRYRIGDAEIASRLSFFLWGTVPDAELRQRAAKGALRLPGELDRQTKRMLRDPRAEALATRFASQWLRLQDIDEILPDALLYPYYDSTLGEAFKRESELFFDSLVRDDRSLLELLTADYTFVNERVAKHYGIPNITGNEFQRVTVPDYRRGILGHGSVLTLTSVADRTSPVMRGKWVMEVLLGSPPPPPPPNVPALEETDAASEGKLLTVRERMEQHRKNPACASCHRAIDPLGLALENFDVTGKYRIKDNGMPIDAASQMYDGTPIDGPVTLRNALLKRKDAVVLSFTENLMTYALGRRVESSDMPAIRRIIRQAEKQDYRISSFIQGVVQSAAFQSSSGNAGEKTDVHH
jgi:mono/diheme cytochrome c family protein